MNFHDLFQRTKPAQVQSAVAVSSGIQFMNVDYTNVDWNDEYNATLLTGEAIEFELKDGSKFQVLPSENVHGDDEPSELQYLESSVPTASIKLYDDVDELVHESEYQSGQTLIIKYGDGAKFVITPTANVETV